MPGTAGPGFWPTAGTANRRPENSAGCGFRSMFQLKCHALLASMRSTSRHRAQVLCRRGPSTVWQSGCVYTRKLVSKFPSFPRAHHPIIRDSTSIWELTGLVLVQVGNRNFQDSFNQVCKSRLLEAPSFQSRLFFAELCNLIPWRRYYQQVQWNRICNLGSLRKTLLFLASECWVLRNTLQSFEVLLLTALSSFPFLPLPKSIVVTTIQVKSRDCDG